MAVARSSFKRKLFRATTLRCPLCGSRKTFIRSWFRRHDRCPTCGIRWRREEGFELGAVTVNTIVTSAALVVAMAIALIATLPDVPVATLIIGLSIAAVVIPVLIYPFTFTIWLALELTIHPPDAGELAEAAMVVAGSLRQ